MVEVGDTVEVGTPIASVESVKASAEIYSPTSGKITEINDALAETPEVLNSDPYGDGWMVKVEAGKLGEVMDAAAYTKYCEERDQ